MSTPTRSPPTESLQNTVLSLYNTDTDPIYVPSYKIHTKYNASSYGIHTKYNICQCLLHQQAVKALVSLCRCTLTRAFNACIQEAWEYVKDHTKI